MVKEALSECVRREWTHEWTGIIDECSHVKESIALDLSNGKAFLLPLCELIQCIIECLAYIQAY